MKDKEIILKAITKMEEAIELLKSKVHEEVQAQDSTPVTPPTGTHPGQP